MSRLIFHWICFKYFFIFPFHVWFDDIGVDQSSSYSPKRVTLFSVLTIAFSVCSLPFLLHFVISLEFLLIRRYINLNSIQLKVQSNFYIVVHSKWFLTPQSNLEMIHSHWDANKPRIIAQNDSIEHISMEIGKFLDRYWWSIELN